jgi:diguanylate cyclase (GGDEF)-like protein
LRASKIKTSPSPGTATAPAQPIQAAPPRAPEEEFVLDVCTLLDRATIQRRCDHINVLLRLSMMSGLQMQLDATLRLLCEFSHEIVAFDRALIYLWNEAEEKSLLRVVRSVADSERQKLPVGSVIDFWCMKYGRPLLMEAGKNAEVDQVLQAMQARSALAVPLLVSNRVMGSVQLFGNDAHAFNREDAQLLYVLSRIAENLLNREYTNEGLIHFAFTDHLTGLKTRGYFEQQLDLEIKRFERKGEKFALLMLDVDHFKQMNDMYGHHAGDRVLHKVAGALSEGMRDVDTVARYGGEEFAIILPDTTLEEAQMVAQRIRARVADAEFSSGKQRIPEKLSISIGVAVFDDDANSKRELVQFADAALYWAKSQGRNRVVTYSELQSQKGKVS